VSGSPFKVSVASTSDASKVVCSGDGLTNISLGHEGSILVDARTAGPGLYSALFYIIVQVVIRHLYGRELIILTRVVGQNIVINVYVCLSVCLPTYLKNHMSRFHRIICRGFLWSWLNWPFSDNSAMPHVLPVLWMTSCFHIMAPVGQNQARRYVSTFVQFAKWWHRGQSLPSLTAFC